MSEFKGTPGPWSRDGYEFFNSDGANIFDLTYGSHTGINEDEANTNLIAAAPELLETCLRIQAHFRQAGVESKAGSLNPIEDSAAQIDAVILKALGQ